MTVYLTGWMVPTMAAYFTTLTVVRMAPQKALKTAVTMIVYLVVLWVMKTAAKKAS